MIKNYYLVITIASFSPVISSPAAFSQAVENTTVPIEKPVSSERVVSSDAKGSSQEKNKTEENGNKQRDDQVFKPSEEISEDLTVPFPTDI